MEKLNKELLISEIRDLGYSITSIEELKKIDNKIALWTTLYLVVRTVTVFGRVVKSVKTNMPICIGFHDQDPIMRIQE